MKTLQDIIILLIIATLCSCNNSSPITSETSQNDKIVNDTTIISDLTNNTGSLTNDDEETENEPNTVTTIKFNEFSISINRLIIYDRDKRLDHIQKDTVKIYVEVGEIFEGQIISVSSSLVTDLTIEQRYETSITITDEGPHCDLTDWKHFYSDWKELQPDKKGKFTCVKYSEKEYEKFPGISIDDLKKRVKEHCGEGWLEQIEKIKSPTDYPSAVGISRYYLKVTGKRKDNGDIVTKLIVVETPMGC